MTGNQVERARRSMNDHVAVEVAGGIQTIRFDRGERSNALTTDMLTTATEAVSLAEVDTSVRVLLIGGMPGVFTAGHDIAELETFVQKSTMGPAGLRFVKTLTMLDKPIVAAVDGLAFGIGAALLFHCDFVVASEWSVFSAPFAEIGLPPEGGLTLLAPRTMGYHRAFELIVMGEPFDAQRALAAGIVNMVVPPEAVERAAHDVAARLAEKPPEAVRAARRLMRGERRDILTRIDQEADVMPNLMRSPAARDALQKFMERRNG